MAYFLVILGFSVCVFEEMMVYSVCNTFLERRFAHKYQDILIVVCMSAVLFMANRLQYSKLNIAAAILISGTTTLWLFGGSIIGRIYYCGLACIVILATEYAGYHILGGDLPSQSLFSTLAVTILTKLSAFIILRIICYSVRNKKVPFFRSSGDHRMLLSLPAFLLCFALRPALFRD